MKAALLIASGAAAGALLRWRLAMLWPAGFGLSAANLLGCLLLGLIVARIEPSEALWALLAVGFCGSLTTFSSFVFELWRQGPGEGGLLFLALNLAGGFALFLLAFSLARPPGA